MFTSHRRLRTLGVEVVVTIRALVLLALALHDGRAAALEVSRVTFATANIALWQPLGALPGLEALVGVHLVLSAKTGQRLRFEQEQISPNSRNEVAGEEDVTEAVADTIVGVWPNFLETQRFWSSQRICLTDDSPSERTPGHGKGSNEHASRDNHDDTGAFILGGGLGGRDTSEDEKPGSLPGRANDEWHSTAELFNHVETRERSSHVDGTKDELYSDGILNAGRVENGCSVLFVVSEAKRRDYGRYEAFPRYRHPRRAGCSSRASFRAGAPSKRGPRPNGLGSGLLFDLSYAVVDDVGNQDTNRDHELVRCDDSTSNFTRQAFRLEHWHADTSKIVSVANISTKQSEHTSNCMAVIWMMLPIMKRPTPNVKLHRRPHQSAVFNFGVQIGVVRLAGFDLTKTDVEVSEKEHARNLTLIARLELSSISVASKEGTYGVISEEEATNVELLQCQRDRKSEH
ncbi:hypothetical protein KC356_g22 [Hortaea werneckii]|nr:hypothetical protein KC356_g22 [Hortaea werneckii]